MSSHLEIRATCCLGVFCALVLVSQPVFAQTEANQTLKLSLCSRENAVESIREQIDLTKTFNDTMQRVGILIRSADLLWPVRKDKARTTFNEAFEPAQQYEKEKLEQPKGAVIARISIRVSISN